MKTKIFVILISVLIAAAFVLNKPTAKENNFPPDLPPVNNSSFIITAYATDKIPTYPVNFFEIAKFDYWFKYLSIIEDTHRQLKEPFGWSAYDSLYNFNPNIYKGEIRDILDEKSGKLFFHRPKIEWLAFGQRSDYKLAYIEPYSNEQWFYSFEEHNNDLSSENYTDVTQFGNGVIVRKASTNMGHTPGYIATGLRTNREQINTRSQFWDAPYPGLGDKQFNWYIKPRIRIDAPITDPGTDVCRIDIYNFRGPNDPNGLIKSVTIKKENFEINGPYTGDYIEEFFPQNNNELKILASPYNGTGNAFNPDNEDKWDYNCAVDFRVHWFGLCDMYIDYIRVEDERAYRLLTGTDLEYNGWLNSELELANYNNYPIHFYSEEIEYSHIPCMSYVYNFLKQNTGKKLKVYEQAAGWYTMHLPQNTQIWSNNLEHFKTNFINKIGVDEISYGSYAFHGNGTKIPNTLPIHDTSINGFPVSTTVVDPVPYDDFLQEFFDNSQMSGPDFPGEFIRVLKEAKSICDLVTDRELSIISPIQTHVHNIDDKLREPTNQEIQLMVYLSLSYGCKGIGYFWAEAMGQDNNGNFIEPLYSAGILNKDLNNSYSPRYLNIYGQHKWDTIVAINTKIRKWENYLMNFPTRMTKSYINRIEAERNLLYQQSYFNEIFTYKPDLTNRIEPDNLPEVQNQRYLQTAIFNNPNEINTKYFMLVNRRCAPYYDINGDYGGGRYVKVQFDVNSQDFEHFNNWKIVDLENNSLVTVFDKRSSALINLGWFYPAEAKLYKIVPVMQEGGSFVCDEEFGDLTVNCKGNVNTNGHSLYVYGNTTVEFNEDCGITAENSENVYFESYNTINLKGKNGAKWTGISANNVSNEILFWNTIFSDIKGGWAINISESNCVLIMNTNFNLQNNNSSDNVGAIMINNLQGPNSLVYIRYNNIFIKNSTAAVAVINEAEAGGSVDIDGNIITASGNGRIGILVTNGILTDVWGNQITGFTENMHYYCTEVSLKENELNSSKDNSKGIIGSAWSKLDLSKTQNSYGENTIINSGNNSINLQVDRSAFDAYDGHNDFSVTMGTGSYNLYGSYMWDYFTPINTNHNCFNGPSGNAIHHITDTIGNTILLFEEGEHVCNSTPTGEFVDFIVNGPLGINDTVYCVLDTINNTYPEALYGYFIDNSIKRNYDSIIVQGMELLNNYPNYQNSIFVIPKLYFANQATDSTHNKIQLLKNYYEQLILINSQNISLVQITNYYIQKCKIALGQYQSALAGFEDIIMQNPYDQIGVLASWDYAATYLLIDTLPGSGGLNELSESSYEYLIDSLRIKKLQKYDNYDVSAFSSNDRKELFKKTGNVLIDERNKQIQKINKLEEALKNTKSDAKKNNQVKKEIEEMKALNEVAKIKKPKTQIDYINMISNDINKLVKNGKSDNVNDNIGIPYEYKLSQNYPNPFNPNTKINYELPKEGKVKLVIYDILGREIKTLVNNEFKQAGRYTVEFNGTQYASGVYFYRIQVEDGKGYTAVKKMVLVK